MTTADILKSAGEVAEQRDKALGKRFAIEALDIAPLVYDATGELLSDMVFELDLNATGTLSLDRLIVDCVLNMIYLLTEDWGILERDGPTELPTEVMDWYERANSWWCLNFGGAV